MLLNVQYGLCSHSPCSRIARYAVYLYANVGPQSGSAVGTLKKSLFGSNQMVVIPFIGDKKAYQTLSNMIPQYYR